MDAPSLRAALVALPLSDHGDAAFTARLAPEQRWSPDHARLVVEEYRRFFELAVTCGHRVVSPPAIDAAWHLHLLHTGKRVAFFCPLWPAQTGYVQPRLLSWDLAA